MFPDQRDAELTGRSVEREPGNGVESAVEDPRPDEEPWRPESGGGEPEEHAATQPESEPEIRRRTRRRAVPPRASESDADRDETPGERTRRRAVPPRASESDADRDEMPGERTRRRAVPREGVETGRHGREDAGEDAGDESAAVSESAAKSEPDAESESEAPAKTGSEAAESRRGLVGRRRAVSIGAVAGVVVLVLVWVSSLSSVQTILRQSFSRLPTAYTEMYLSGTPTVSGITLSVPVTVVNHATTQDSFTLKVWTVNGVGKTDTTTSIKVTPKHGEATVVVKVAVQISSDAQVLWINLVGQPQTLHYRIAGEAIPSPTATASATPTTTAKH
ncbi:hypothetical protein KDK95_03600 [Actinospica sp. MGRD01-02]|uniref:Uncharacterized protein n=1 Tax=Actinospica acidithermotolerans TaxID=2828514 RepID=A0A941E391_9ACTN|nr:hypothetical protein [Actinospica acidithermotolerans]MBR7825380.1 hypothetical protein [Actinospica acidithermotolerans]